VLIERTAELFDRQQYERFRVSPIDPATIRAADVQRILAQQAASSGGKLRVEKFAESFAGRPITLATLGSGPKCVLMWTQMHGDEPTHTAVVLDLISYLLRSPAEPLAADILANCTLYILPLLNPDGAERVSRFNAQDIDVNRDALRLATPEGRALRRAVESLKPDFGFNLHNQNARTSVGNPPKPAAVSVLAPPPDAHRIETQSMRLAKQMCACFVDAVRPYVRGMISRYDDTFEPRAFGDTIQATGCATMLVEAGGWPDADPEPIVRLHFHGLLATLHAIATDRFRVVDPNIYESLPQSNSRPLVDCKISGGYVLDAEYGEAYQADLGVDHSHGGRLAITPQRNGRIVDVGDLSTTAGKVAVDAADCLLLPGHIAFENGWSASGEIHDEKLNSLLAGGYTTVIGLVDLVDHEAIDAIDRERTLPVNWGFVGRLDSARPLSAAALVEHVGLAAEKGVLAVVGEHADESFWQRLECWGIPLLQSKQLAPPSATTMAYRDLVQYIHNVNKLLKLPRTCGRIERGSFADLQFFQLDAKPNADQAVDWQRLSRVIVAGEAVWESGRRLKASPGVHVRRS
jgi:hypothetical protein